MYEKSLTADVSVTEKQLERFLSGALKSGSDISVDVRNFLSAGPDSGQTECVAQGDKVLITRIRQGSGGDDQYKIEVSSALPPRVENYFVDMKSGTYVRQGTRQGEPISTLVERLQDQQIYNDMTLGIRKNWAAIGNLVKQPEQEVIPFFEVEEETADLLQRLWEGSEIDATLLNDDQVDSLRRGCMRILVHSSGYVSSFVIFAAAFVPEEKFAPLSFDEIKSIGEGGLLDASPSTIARLMADREAVMGLGDLILQQGYGSPWYNFQTEALSKDFELQEKVDEGWHKLQAILGSKDKAAEG